ncbi:MAG: hypothetical protein LBT71_04510 [Azoarcus sp.]|jgi:uncharacterized membrane protein YfcA|nr:hypothetical protein [Azoarcus sp.]
MKSLLVILLLLAWFMLFQFSIVIALEDQEHQIRRKVFDELGIKLRVYQGPIPNRTWRSVLPYFVGGLTGLLLGFSFDHGLLGAGIGLLIFLAFTWLMVFCTRKEEEHRVSQNARRSLAEKNGS